ncbi:hypothetical protein [Streptococcus jiangjianxini]|uniref:hypothetical protein n=1 Tax=Streptococcus jiangjianxini TaxID=3161189 RepID=UPI0032EBA457
MGKPLPERTVREIKYLLANSDLDTGKIATRFEVARSTVNKINRRFAIREVSRKKWTAREVDFLRYNHDKLTVEQMAYRLNDRTVQSVQQKLYGLGLLTKKQAFIDIDQLRESEYIAEIKRRPKITVDDSFTRRRPV